MGRLGKIFCGGLDYLKRRKGGVWGSSNKIILLSGHIRWTEVFSGTLDVSCLLACQLCCFACGQNLEKLFWFKCVANGCGKMSC